MCAGVISGDVGQDFSAVVPTSFRTSITRTGPHVHDSGTFSVVISLAPSGPYFFSNSSSQPRTSGAYGSFSFSAGRAKAGGTRCVPAIASIRWPWCHMSR
jgi:hypothetical protein